MFQEIGVCDYPYNVDCQGTPPQKEVTTEAHYSTTDNYSGQYVSWLRKIPARESRFWKMLMPVLSQLLHIMQIIETFVFCRFRN
jgi:hypothetical protein